MPNEADTCRTYVIPKLKSAGWEDDYISEQWRIVAHLDGLKAKVNALWEPCPLPDLPPKWGKEN